MDGTWHWAKGPPGIRRRCCCCWLMKGLLMWMALRGGFLSRATDGTSRSNDDSFSHSDGSLCGAWRDRASTWLRVRSPTCSLTATGECCPLPPPSRLDTKRNVPLTLRAGKSPSPLPCVWRLPIFSSLVDDSSCSSVVCSRVLSSLSSCCCSTSRAWSSSRLWMLRAMRVHISSSSSLDLDCSTSFRPSLSAAEGSGEASDAAADEDDGSSSTEAMAVSNLSIFLRAGFSRPP
mmetsp:Transcript_17027/g.40915  ORF Transcript_17027/g.40915 Transcript_17027/m.40915 type:complete len:233 (-) Transcript_17027:44-742(-)